MKIQLSLFLILPFIFNQSYSFNNSTNFNDSSKTITCVFYLEREDELMDSMMIIFDINELLYSDMQGKIVIKNIKPGYHSLTCEKNNIIVIIDSILLDSPIMSIRLYDYMFEPHKNLIDRANYDIQSKQIKILEGGFLRLKDYTDSEKAFQNKYGIEFFNGGCDPTDLWLYNNKIFNYLDSLYGNGWREDYKKLKYLK